MYNQFKINSRTVYNLLYNFIDQYYEHTNENDIGGLAGDMIINDKNETLDPAIWYDWLEATTNKEVMSVEEAYDAVLVFLNNYANRVNSQAIKDFISYLTFERWERSCEEAKQ